MIDPSMVAINMPIVVFDEGDPLIAVAHRAHRGQIGHRGPPTVSLPDLGSQGSTFTFTSTEILSLRPILHRNRRD